VVSSSRRRIIEVPSQPRSEGSIAALVTTLITERPLCLDCIATKALATSGVAAAILVKIERVGQLHRHTTERCRACGVIGVVFSVERPTPR
jgi:hypothetical protein